MSVTPRQFIGTLAAILLILGVAGAFWPVTLNQGEGSVLCGITLIDRSGDALDDDILDDDRNTDPLYGAFNLADYGSAYRHWCRDGLSTRRLWSWPCVVIGLVVLVGTVVINRAPKAA